MNYKFVVGVDVSKHVLDAVLMEINQKEEMNYIQVSNDAKGMEQLLEWLKDFNIDLSCTVFCMEHTGLYNYPALCFFTAHEYNVWLENATHIKKSLGLQRGKNDRIDAKRIAEFASRFMDQLRLWKPSREIINKIRHLMALRDRLIDSQKKLLVPVEEFKKLGAVDMAKMLSKSMSHAVKGIEKDIEQIEKQIKSIIDGDDHLKKLFCLVTSVVGIGFVSAVQIIVYTNEFKLFKDPRKFACYCGVAPFEHTSGTIRWRTRVSHLANKKLKTLLHMASLTAIKFDVDIKAYYEKKVAEGKNKMSVLNAIRNKLISRVFAVVNRETDYVKKIFKNDLVLS